MDLNGKRIFLYMNFFKDDKSIGITKKILSQINTLRNMGMEVVYTSYTNDGAAICDNKDNKIFEQKYVLPINVFKRYGRRFLLIKTVIKYLKVCGMKFDYSYMRWHTFDRLYLKMLKAFKACGTVNIIEAHAWTPNPKVTSLISKYQIYNDNKYSKYACKYVSLVAGVSEYDNIWGIKTVKIDNAVDLKSITQRHWNKDDSVIRILSVSNERNYHGYDRLLKGIHDYYLNGGKRKIQVHFVGVFLNSTKELTHQLGLDNIVYFHGKMQGEKLDELYDNSDIGIGALAHHRVGMFSGSSLKTKEYFAKGLPFIYGWKEPAFDETYPYALKIELNEEPIDMQSIFDFYDRIKNDDKMLSTMREFARINFSWENEFNKIFNAL